MASKKSEVKDDTMDVDDDDEDDDEEVVRLTCIWCLRSVKGNIALLQILAKLVTASPK